MEPGDWKYVVVLAVMVAGLGLVAGAVPRMEAAEDRFRVEMQATRSATSQAEFQRHLAAADSAADERLFWGSMGTLGAFAALIALLSLFFVGIRGPEGRGGLSRQAAKREEEGTTRGKHPTTRRARKDVAAKGKRRPGDG
jgi:hypothetical protein